MSAALHILVGEGIECEKESMRFFSRRDAGFDFDVRYLRIQDLLQKKSGADALKAGDWIMVPGGFSFADHFGSGKLLAYELKKAAFFERAVERGVNFLGVCNGFQVLTEAGFFGGGVSLEANALGQGFTNRWARMRGAGFAENENFYLPVRHGEGRVQRLGGRFDEGVEAFLTYDDPDFDNGSLDRVAGLCARRGASHVIGLMPHPEIAARERDQPDTLGPEWPEDKRQQLSEPASDGVRLMNFAFTWARASH